MPKAKHNVDEQAHDQLQAPSENVVSHQHTCLATRRIASRVLQMDAELGRRTMINMAKRTTLIDSIVNITGRSSNGLSLAWGQAALSNSSAPGEN